MTLNFVIPEFNIGGAGTPPLQFFRRGFNLNGSNGGGGWTDIILHGNTALTLTNAKANGLNYLKLFGDTEQLPETYLDSVTLGGGCEQINLPAGHTQLEYVYMTNGSYIRIEDLPISARYRVEFDFQTNSLGSSLRNYLGGRADEVAAGGGFRLSKLASSNNNRVVLYGFETGTEYYDPTAAFTANTRYKYTYDNGVCTLESGGNVVSTNTFTVTDDTSTDWGINDYTSSGSWSAYHDPMYVYSVKVWNPQGELVMDLVPDLTSSNVVCFYDMVTGNTREASGGTFEAGTIVPNPNAPMDIISNNGALKARHQSGLPLGYKLVDYIKSNAMIELDSPTNDTMEFVARFYREGANAQYIYQSDTSSGGTTNTTAYISSGGNWRFGRRTASISTDIETMITSVQNVNGVWINGEQVGTYEGVTAFTSSNNLRLFGTQSSPTLRFYGLKVYQNGAPFYDLVPCQRESDLSYGVYDFVTGQFFTNTDATITMGSFVSDAVVVKGAGQIETVADTGYFGNLVNLNALTSGYYYNTSGVYTSANNVYLTDWIKVYNGDTITVYFKKMYAANAPVVRMNIFDAQKNWVSQSTMTLNDQDEDVAVLNITADGYIRISGASNLLDWDTAQIIRGSYTVDTMPVYKAYVPYHTATAEDLLKIGDYQDVQSVLDGVVTRNVGVMVLDGTENWQLATATDLVQFYIASTQGIIKNNVSLMSTIAPYGCTASTRTQYDFGCYSGNSGNLCFQMKGSSTLTTVSAWTSFLADQYANGTSVIIVYPLPEPTTETVTPQLLLKSPVTQTAGSISNLPIAITESSHTIPTPTQPLQINCNNGVLGIDSQGNITVTGTTETVEVTGKNLFDQSTATRYQTSWSSNGSGSWLAVSDSSAAVTYGCYVEPNTTYTLSKKGGSRLIITGYTTKTEPSSEQTTPADYKIKTDTTETIDGSYTFTTPADCTWILFGLRQNNASFTFPYDVQLELGSTATEYQPYFSDTATAEMLLGLGDYQDVQNVTNGHITRNVGIKVLDGTESWESTSTSGLWLLRNVATASLPNTCICTHFLGVSSTTSGLDMPDLSARYGVTGYNDRLYIRYNSLVDVNELKQFLANQYAQGTPVVVVYPSSSPTTETVVHQHLSIQAGTNTVEITQASMDNLELEVSYKGKEGE